MPSDLLIPLLGGSAFQIAPAIQNGVFAELLFNVEHGFLNFTLPLQLSRFLPQPLLLYLDIIEQVELYRGFRLCCTVSSPTSRLAVMVSLRIDSFGLTFVS